MKTCEVCGDVVVHPQKAIHCPHTVYLCEQCKTTCPGALRYCVQCEEKGR
jgi:hypothetical protein